jgi:hypothetical protein
MRPCGLFGAVCTLGDLGGGHRLPRMEDRAVHALFRVLAVEWPVEWGWAVATSVV